MEKFVKPRDFVTDILMDHVPPGTAITVDETGLEMRARFNVDSHLKWVDILGPYLAVPYTTTHHVLSLIFSFTKEIAFPGFLKAHHLHITDEYIHMLATGIMKPTEIDVEAFYTIWYVGNRSCITGSNISYQGVTICSTRNVVVPVDMATRKVTSLDLTWKNKVMKNITRKGIKNIPLDLPKFHENSSVLYQFSMEIQKEHIDENQHTNMKVYVYGGYVAIRQAMETHILPEFKDYSYEQVIIREATVVFDQESVLGDTVHFKLCRVTDGTYSMTCYKGNARLAYGSYQVVPIESIPSHI